MYDQLNDYFDKILSKYQCRYRKWFGTQHCLLSIIENQRKRLDSECVSVSLLPDLSKAFDCLSHDSLIAKSHGYVIKEGHLNFLFS